jgi:hypothetical protein
MSGLVSLTLLAFAALILLLPLYRLAAAQWPAPVDEFLLADGRTLLVDAGVRYRGDGVKRSRPLNAARIRFADGRSELAYVVAMKIDGTARPPLEGVVWSPAAGQCELALAGFGEPPVRWLPCGEIAQVVKPNRMTSSARLRLALDSYLPGLSLIEP